MTNDSREKMHIKFILICIYITELRSDSDKFPVKSKLSRFFSFKLEINHKSKRKSNEVIKEYSCNKFSQSITYVILMAKFWNYWDMLLI